MKLLSFPLCLCLFLAKTASQNLFDASLAPLLDPARAPFHFGVASGDPLPDAVVLWTKIIPETADSQQVAWQVAADSAMLQVVQSGTAATGAASAFTVKVDVRNLSPGTTYFYRFQFKNAFSPTGRTKTAPDGDPKLLRFAVVSCSNFPSGYFNAYEHIARRSDLDAVLHLGDYIYEYGSSHGGRSRMLRRIVRQHLPDKELTALQDYRTRYAQYRLDSPLRECHRLHPFIVIWDDHEIANNANASGAGNHDANEGGWQQRAAAARQAYFEWMPIRENEGRSIIRRFTWGSLADLWMLDGRLEGRSPQARGEGDPAWQSPERRKMLGEAQTCWLLDGMAASKARWKVIGNQVIFSPLHDSKVFNRRPDIKMDRWDGYPAERQRIFDFSHEHHLRNIVVVTGDVHTAWAFDLTDEPRSRDRYNRCTGKGVIGAEFGTPSITSTNFDEIIPRFLTWEAKRRFLKNKNNPHLRFLDLVRHGYFALTLTPERVQADWVFMKTIKKPDGRVGKRRSRQLNFVESSGELQRVRH